MGFERDPEGHYFGFFMIAQEKETQKAIKLFKERK